MSRRRLAALFICLAMLLAGLSVSFIDLPRPDDSHLALDPLPPPPPGNPLAPGTKLMARQIQLPDGLEQSSDRYYALLKGDSDEPDLAREVVTLNAELLNEIDKALLVDRWRVEGDGTETMSRLQQLARLKKIQSLANAGLAHRGVLHSLEAAELLGHLIDSRPSLVSLVIAMGGRRAIAIDGNFPNRLLAIGDRDALATVLQKLEGLRYSVQMWNNAVKTEYWSTATELRKDPMAYGKSIQEYGEFYGLDSDDYRLRLILPNRTLALFSEMTSAYLDPIPYSDVMPVNIPQPSPVSANYGGQVIAGISANTYQRVLETWINGFAKWEALAALAALKLYETDHGTFPESLDALVPDYLSLVPLDPYDGMSMRFDRENRRVYSVGTDYIDSGGSDGDGVFGDANEPTLFIGPAAIDSNESDENP